MQLIGQAVKHSAFGSGIITDCSDKSVTICFSQGDKKFVYPDAFVSFLSLRDKAVQRQIAAICSRRAVERNQQKKAEQKEQDRRTMLHNIKIVEKSQAIFELLPQEADRVFQERAISAGCYTSGYSKGMPRVPKQLKPNSACLIAERIDSTSGKNNQRVLGAFMVADDFWGENCLDGIIRSHDKYVLRLDPEINLPLSNYWGEAVPARRKSGPSFRYFQNSIMQRVLFDMQKAARGTPQEADMMAFYQYYCDINRLPTLKQAGG